ncbi:MAG: YtxH domain-containing protein [Candidatus Neomarinimicrobiota bacterium]
MKRILLFTIAGSLLGFSYYYFIGCNNGCSITGSPVNSSIYGAVFGFILGFPSNKN